VSTLLKVELEDPRTFWKEEEQTISSCLYHSGAEYLSVIDS